MNPQNFWNKYEFSVNQTLLFKAGHAEVFVKHIPGGWLLKCRGTDQRYDELQMEEVDGIEDDSDVFHFQTGKSHLLHVVPALPDKAVVFRNNKNIKVSAGQLANLFFQIPLTMQFYFQEIKDEYRLLEFPLQRLSDTWFGEADNGEPAYSIGSNYNKFLDDISPSNWQAVVPVEIVNSTNSLLDLQRLILRVEEFSLYQRNRQIFSNHISIDFKGQEHVGSVNLTVKKDIHGQKSMQIAKPRNSESKNILRQSFHFIKNIYQS